MVVSTGMAAGIVAFAKGLKASFFRFALGIAGEGKPRKN